MRTREEHLVWCKEQALEYLDQGDIKNAIASMLSDLGKHDETKDIGMKMAMLGMLCVVDHDEMSARRFIEGFR